MKSSSSPQPVILFLALFLTTIIIATSNISKDVLDALSEIYEEPITDVKLKSSSQAKLINLLGAN